MLIGAANILLYGSNTPPVPPLNTSIEEPLIVEYCGNELLELGHLKIPSC